MGESLLSVVRPQLLRLSQCGNGGLRLCRSKQASDSNLSGSSTSILVMSHKDAYRIH